MAKKGGSLIFPTNPLAAMQELSELDALPMQTEALNPPEVNYLNTEVSTDLSKELSVDISTHKSKAEASSAVASARRARTVAPRATPSKTAASQASPPNALPQTARRRLLAQAEKEATTRLSIDVPLPLYNRIKQYIAVNNVESIRALTLALYEDFLAEEHF